MVLIPTTRMEEETRSFSPVLNVHSGHTRTSTCWPKIAVPNFIPSSLLQSVLICLPVVKKPEEVVVEVGFVDDQSVDESRWRVFQDDHEPRGPRILAAHRSRLRGSHYDLVSAFCCVLYACRQGNERHQSLVCIWIHTISGGTTMEMRNTRFAFYLTDPPLYLRNGIFWKC